MTNKKGSYGARSSILMLLAFLMGALAVRFALTPGLEKQEAEQQQTMLLESIQQGDGVVEFDLDILDEDVDFYDLSEDVPTEEPPVLAVSASEAELPAEEIPLINEEPSHEEFARSEPTVEATARPVNPGVVNGIGVLTIERLGMRLPVVEGCTSPQLKIAVGHVPQTAAVGDIGNAVIAGHRSYTYGEHFNRLGEAEIGDKISYDSIEGEHMVFEVDEILEIHPGDQSAFDQPTDKAQLTLYTCTPIRVASHRLLIRATRQD